MAEGWISIHRKIQECWIWQNEPFSKGQAWIDLLLMANSKDRKVFINGELVLIKRGQVHTSLLKLSERWHWSRNKTRRFIDVLETDKMLYCDRTTQGTTITIVNYSNYQYQGTTNRTTNDTTVDTTVEPQTINKQLNNNKYIVEIVNYLNSKCGTNYKPSTVNTKKHISARLNDGYKLNDFYKVIDKKVKDWKGTNMEQYLRPDTLFGSKFESYLNQKIVGSRTDQHFDNENKYDFDDLERRLLGES